MWKFTIAQGGAKLERAVLPALAVYCSLARALCCFFLMPAAVLLAPSRAAGQISPAPLSVRAAVHYSAPDSCPPAAEFLVALRQRAPGVQQVSESPSVRIEVRLVEKGGEFNGTLVLVQRGVESFPREVQSAYCEEVVEALALTAAISLVGPTPMPEPVLPPDPSQEEVRRWGLLFDVSGLVGLPVDVGWGSGLELAIGLVPESGPFFPSLSIGGLYLSNALLTEPDELEVELMGLAASGCTGGIGPEEVKLTPCLAAQLGVLKVSGKESDALVASERTVIAWSALGPLLRVEPTLVAGVRLSIKAAALVVLTPQRYLLRDGGQQVGETPVFTPWLGVGLAFGARP